MSRKKHPNEVTLLRYFEFCKHAEGKNEKTIRKSELVIMSYQRITHFEDFRNFSRDSAIRFKADLMQQDKKPGTIVSTLRLLQHFFRWLSQQLGYRRKIKIDDIAYLNPDDKLRRRTSTSESNRPFPRLYVVCNVIKAMPCTHSYRSA